MKFFMSIFLTFFMWSAYAEMLQASKFKDVKQGIGKAEPYFLEIGSESCRSCQKMGVLLYDVKHKHPEYNVHFIDVRKERESAYELKVRMIPTQIIYDADGKEVYRHIGGLSSKELQLLLKKYKF